MPEPEEQTPPIAPHSRVVLKGGYEIVYPAAWAGSEGWVRDTKTDEDGFEMVLIEWDKDHWRYSGETDRWSFADHFRVIEGPPAGPEPEPEAEEVSPTENAPGILALLQSANPPATREEERCPDCGGFHGTYGDEAWKEYFDGLQRALDKAADSDNFALLTLAPVAGQPDLILPHLFIQTMDPDTAYLLYSQMGRLASAALDALVDKHHGGSDGRQAADVQPEDPE